MRVLEIFGLDEAATNRAVEQHFKKAGYKKIGSGADANVYAKDEHSVVKILMPEEPGGEAERVFQNFYEFAQKHRAIPNLPKFKPIERINIGGEEYTLVGMERLKPIPVGSFEEAMVWQLSDLATKKITWEQALELAKSPEEWKYYSGMPAEEIVNIINNLSAEQLNEYGMLFTLMTLLYYTGRINHIGWDLHTENVMQRSDGRLVVIDPWFAMNEEHA